MNISNKFNLKWGDFSENARSTLKEEQIIKDFTDITLVCEDGTQIEAHKLVLARGSTLFWKILRLKNGPSSIFYMKGIKGNQLDSVVSFLYNGEVEIEQDDLNDFLTMAEDFQLKGLIGLKESDFDKQTKVRPETYIDMKLSTKTKQPQNEMEIPAQIKSEPFIEDPVSLVNVERIKVAYLDKKASEMIDKSSTNWSCKICGKEAISQDAKSNLKRHTQVHMEGISYPCNLCGKKYRSKQKLRHHEVKFHSAL